MVLIQTSLTLKLHNKLKLKTEALFKHCQISSVYEVTVTSKNCSQFLTADIAPCLNWQTAVVAGYI